MAYVGASPDTGTFKRIDGITPSFNDSVTEFTVSASGASVLLQTPQQLIVSLDGVIQEPGEAYTVSGSKITFTEAPNTNATFFAVQLGSVGDVGIPSAGSIDSSMIKDNSINNAMMQDDAIDTAEIADGAVERNQLNNGAVNSDKLDSGAVIEGKVATDAITSLNIKPNTILRGKVVFSAAVQEKANVLTSNIKGTIDAHGEDIINVDPLNNAVLFFSGNSHSNTSHTLNFINMGGVEVGNTVSFVATISNNTNSFANISNVRIDGNEARGHEMRKGSNDLNSNTLFVSGGPIAAGAGIGGDGTANVNVYSFNITSMSKNPDAYSVFVSRTDFT